VQTASIHISRITPVQKVC